MSDPFVSWGVAGLAVALLALVVAVPLAVADLRATLAQRRAIRDEAEAFAAAREHAEAVDSVVVDLMVLEMEVQQEARKANYRHNLHCPDCGRFAKAVLPDNNEVVACKVHGVKVRWKDIPVDWANTFYLTPQAVVFAHALEDGVPGELVEILRPDTAPIDVIVPDDLSMMELEELGAVL